MVNLADFGGPQFKPNEPGPGGHGQQGTLFSNRRLNAANRTGDEVGHKGFSQNRLNAVRDAVQVYVSAAPPTEHIASALTGMEAAGIRKGWGSEGSIGPREAVATQMTRDVLHQTIARSTVPMETLNNPEMSAYSDEVRNRGTRIHVVPDGPKGGAGDFDPNTGLIRIVSHTADSPLPIHELGHQQDWGAYELAKRRQIAETGSDHVEAVPGSFSGASGMKTAHPAGMATVEGFADAFADRHFRPGPNTDRRYAEGATSGYSRFRDNQWAEYGGQDPATVPAEFGPLADTYANTRRMHGGRNVRPSGNMQQLQFGRHAEPSPGDDSWLDALSGRAR